MIPHYGNSYLYWQDPLPNDYTGLQLTIPEPPTVTGLIIQIFYDARLLGVATPVELGLKVRRRDGTDIVGTENYEALPAQGEGYGFQGEYRFADIKNAREINAVVVSKNQTLPTPVTDLDFKLRVFAGLVKRGGTQPIRVLEQVFTPGLPA